MKIAAERKVIEAALDEYRARLDQIPDEQFDLTPPAGGWSYAEVYSHILQATIGASIAAEKCTSASTRTTHKKPNLTGWLVLLLGWLPPVKVPEATVTPVSKITKEDARNLLIKCRKRMEAIIPLIYNCAKNKRINHPRLGMLNARQWLKFIRIHLLHHLKQLNRVKNLFLNH